MSQKCSEGNDGRKGPIIRIANCLATHDLKHPSYAVRGALHEGTGGKRMIDRIDSIRRTCSGTRKWSLQTCTHFYEIAEGNGRAVE
ncbi:hypothetical protein CEXT_547771 [Caerostris extrusa]|uniref:Uncharacterized protein n=1 Tax=Caerostris extrusa TaxID=172846 RepID=A0AAV4RK80_CAEEX|nr:hypothetical protein CEXT_547771 [Caerostris extrusa]